MKTLEQRFWPKVKVGSPNECWIWRASILRNGYGRIGAGGAGNGYLMAHRVSWEIANGPIPKGTGHHGTCVRHTCDNRSCVNPFHLELGSQKQNLNDMDYRGRRALGVLHGQAKLNPISVRKIRNLFKQGKSQLFIASQFSVSQRTIWAIKNNKTWVHVK